LRVGCLFPFWICLEKEKFRQVSCRLVGSGWMGGGAWARLAPRGLMFLDAGGAGLKRRTAGAGRGWGFPCLIGRGGGEMGIQVIDVPSGAKARSPWGTKCTG
jgi:hypothetical protein